MFAAVEDLIIEDTEAFTFQVTTAYPLDDFAGGISQFLLYIIDDDGSLQKLTSFDFSGKINGQLFS